MTETAVVGKSLEELTVVELRKELEKRKHNTSGIKVILIDRLERTLKAEGHNALEFRFFADAESAPPSANVLEVKTNGDSAETEPEKKEDTQSAVAVAPLSPADTSTAPPSESAEGEEGGESEAAVDPVPVSSPPPAETAEAQPAAASPVVGKAVVDVVDPEKEREMAPRSFWVRGLRVGTKASELKAFFTPHGHVARAKIFTVRKGAAADGSAGCMGYLTMSSVPEAELAVVKLHMASFKGNIITITKATADSIPFVKKKDGAKKENPTESATEEKKKAEKDKDVPSKIKEAETAKDDKRSSRTGERRGERSDKDRPRRRTEEYSKSTSRYRSDRMPPQRSPAKSSRSALPSRFRKPPPPPERDYIDRLVTMRVEEERRQRDAADRLHAEQLRLYLEKERLENERLRAQLLKKQSKEHERHPLSAHSSLRHRHYSTSESARASGDLGRRRDSREIRDPRDPREMDREREKRRRPPSPPSASRSRFIPEVKRRRSRTPPPRSSYTSTPAFNSYKTPGADIYSSYTSGRSAYGATGSSGSSSWMSGREAGYGSGYSGGGSSAFLAASSSAPRRSAPQPPHYDYYSSNPRYM